MTYRHDVLVCDVLEALKVQESLAPFRTRDAQDIAVFANDLARNAYEVVLTHEGTIV